MAYEIRKVPANWQHPKDEEGDYKALFDSIDFDRRTKRWDEENEMWAKGYRSGNGPGHYVPIEPEHQHMTYVQWTDVRPDPAWFMPQWPVAERTHYMLYEDVTEGTPLSPAFEKATDLLNWVIVNDPNYARKPDEVRDFWQRWVQQEAKAANLKCGILRATGIGMAP